MKEYTYTTDLNPAILNGVPQDCIELYLRCHNKLVLLGRIHEEKPKFWQDFEPQIKYSMLCITTINTLYPTLKDIFFNGNDEGDHIKLFNHNYI